MRERRRSLQSIRSAWIAERFARYSAAMVHENVEAWQRSNEAWNRGDRAGWIAEIPPEWEFHTSGVFPGLKTTYRGIEGAAELWDTMREPWDTFEVVLVRTEELDDVLLSLVTFRVRGRDGLEVTREWAYVVAFRDGQQRRVDNFEHWDTALKAVGIA